MGHREVHEGSAVAPERSNSQDGGNSLTFEVSQRFFFRRPTPSSESWRPSQAGAFMVIPITPSCA